MTYVQGLVKTYTKQELGVDLDSSVNNSSTDEAFFDRKPTRKPSEVQQEEPRKEDGDGLVYS